MDDADRAEYERLMQTAPTPEQEAAEREAADERRAQAEAMHRDWQLEATRRAALSRSADWLNG